MIEDILRYVDINIMISFLAGALISAFLVTVMRPNSAHKSFVSRQSSKKGVLERKDKKHILFEHERLSASAIARRAREFKDFMNMRRTLRFFSRDPVDISVIKDCVAAAGTAPSGAHQQPWTFVIVKDQSIKDWIRKRVEEEEIINYDKRMRKEWLNALTGIMEHLHEAGVEKPYLSDAPYLIVVLRQTHSYDKSGEKVTHYYPSQSCGIASGMLISAIHNANLVTLTSTPMGAENDIRQKLGRPSNEKVYLLMPVGFPADDGTVPYRTVQELRKPLHEICHVV